MGYNPVMNFEKVKVYAVFLAIAVTAACSPGERTPAPPVKGSTVDLSALKSKFEFRGGIVFQSDLDGDNDIYLLTKDGVTRLTDDPASDEFPKWSPDGTRIAFSSNRSGRFQIYTMSMDGSDVRQVTRSENDAIEEAWFPDGAKIAYTEQKKKALGKSYVLWSVDLTSGAAERLLPEFDGSSALPEFSPAAPLLGFTGKRMRGWDVYVADLSTAAGAPGLARGPTSAAKARPLTGASRPLTEGGKACRPHFSPDGAKIAYTSSEADGKGDIWLMNPDGSGQERLTERPDTYDYFASWSPDGKYVVFSSGTKHYPAEGVWSLALVKIGTKRVIPLFESGARDVFPDWR
jgi:Tol biopolymer transport system component